jgi:hypothetical protein
MKKNFQSSKIKKQKQIEIKRMRMKSGINIKWNKTMILSALISSLSMDVLHLVVDC